MRSRGTLRPEKRNSATRISSVFLLPPSFFRSRPFLCDARRTTLRDRRCTVLDQQYSSQERRYPKAAADWPPRDRGKFASAVRCARARAPLEIATDTFRVSRLVLWFRETAHPHNQTETRTLSALPGQSDSSSREFRGRSQLLDRQAACQTSAAFRLRLFRRSASRFLSILRETRPQRDFSNQLGRQAGSRP